MSIRRKFTVVTLSAATLGAALLVSAPARAGIIVPQVHQAGIIMDDLTAYPPGPSVTDAAAAAAVSVRPRVQ